MATILSHSEIASDAALIARLESGECFRLQFSRSSEYDESLFKTIDILAQRFPKQIQLRFFMHIGEEFDFRLLTKFPNVESLWLDPLRAKNWDVFKNVRHVKALTVGILDIPNKTFLRNVVHSELETLILSQMQTRALDLSYLAQGKNLTELRLVGHKKNISAIGALQRLQKLAFSPHRNDSYEFLTGLPRLTELEFSFGGCEDLDSVSSVTIKKLYLSRVKYLTRLGPISRFKNLECIRVENQPLLSKQDYETDLRSIRRVNWSVRK